MKKILFLGLGAAALISLYSCASGGGSLSAVGVSPQGVSAEYVLVEGGTFQMGSITGEVTEKPVHQVTVSSFFIGKFEVTQQQWFEVMGTTVRQQRDKGNPAWVLRGEGPNHPMCYVNWYEAVEFCNKLSEKEALTPVYSGSGDGIVCDWNANGYRLPTEAEWEYAAKGGNKDGGYLYIGGNDAEAIGWFKDNSGGISHAVGQKLPNSLGLYDMGGNVEELCWDWFESYSDEAQTDPTGPADQPPANPFMQLLGMSTSRTFRGGFFNGEAARLRPSSRFHNAEEGPGFRGVTQGFRVVRSAK